jgi:two-component system, OmpR family, response regulator ChvI
LEDGIPWQGQGMGTISQLASNIQETVLMKDTSSTGRIAIVDDDALFRETLALGLADEGYEVTSLSSGAAALDHLASGGRADVILLDWRMPGMNGLEVLRGLRRAGNTTPVIFLTVLSDDVYEEAALEGGAVDFIDKSRRLSILVKRLRLIAEGARPGPEPEGRQPGDVLHLGRLELRFDIHRASWAGRPIDLTLTEFKIIALLALRAGEDVSYREIYDLVHGKDFVAGSGDNGYRANVRTFIKRIRKKLRDVDPECENIHNYTGFGYRYHWTADGGVGSAKASRPWLRRPLSPAVVPPTPQERADVCAIQKVS